MPHGPARQRHEAPPIGDGISAACRRHLPPSQQRITGSQHAHAPLAVGLDGGRQLNQNHGERVAVEKGLWGRGGTGPVSSFTAERDSCFSSPGKAQARRGACGAAGRQDSRATGARAREDDVAQRVGDAKGLVRGRHGDAAHAAARRTVCREGARKAALLAPHGGAAPGSAMLKPFGCTVQLANARKHAELTHTCSCSMLTGRWRRRSLRGGEGAEQQF